jgi:hypothetical protein
MTKSERYEKMAQFVRQISRFTQDDECQTCNERDLGENPACPAHEPWDMPIDDALDTIRSVIGQARELVVDLKL